MNKILSIGQNEPKHKASMHHVPELFVGDTLKHLPPFSVHCSVAL